MPVTVALIRLPELLAEVVRDAFTGDPAVSVDALCLAGDEGLDDALGRQRLDVVIIGVDQDGAAGDTAAPCDVLLRHPDLIVVMLSMDARRAWLCELRPSSRPLREVSPQGLREAVHAALALKGSP